MATYKVTDPATGQTVRLTGDSPPSEKELEEIFAKVGPPKGFVERNARTISAVARPTLEMGGMLAGGAVAGTGAIPGGPAAVPAAVAGGALGFAGGKSAADALDRYLGLKAPIRTVPEAARETAGNVMAGAEAEMGGRIAGKVLQVGAKKAAEVAANRLPPTLGKFFGVPEAVTKYAQTRGAEKVFAPGNLEEGAARAKIGEATADLAGRRAAVGEQIGAAEAAVGASPAGSKTPRIRHILETLRSSLYGRGISDPRTAALSSKLGGKDVGILQELETVLAPVEKAVETTNAYGLKESAPVVEKLTLRQALNAKKIIDHGIKLESGKITAPTKQLLLKINGMIREAVKKDVGKDVTDLWSQFGPIADAQEKLMQYTGSRGLDASEKLAVSKLRGIMMAAPEKLDGIVKILGDGLPGGEKQARAIIDSIAAESFKGSGPGAPSNIILKGASAVGLTGGTMARGVFRGAEAMGRASQGPFAGTKLGSSAAIAALRARRKDEK